VAGSDKKGYYAVDFQISDLGNSSSCEFTVEMDETVPENVAIHINDRKGLRLAELTAQAPNKSVPCFDLADGTLLLVSNPTGFFDVTDVIMSQTLTGLNGSKMNLKVK